MKLWEKSEIVKIGVKRGVQNTNNERMAEDLKVDTVALVFRQLVTLAIVLFTLGLWFKVQG